MAENLKLILATSSDKNESNQALEILQTIPDADVKQVNDSVLRSTFEVPFVQTPSGARYFGLTGIRWFVHDRESR